MDTNITGSRWLRYCPTIDNNSNASEGPFLNQGKLNPCFLSISTCTVHILFSFLILLVLVWQTCSGKNSSGKKARRYPGHSVRWISTMVLFVVATGAIGERILTDLTFSSRTESGSQIPLYFPLGMLVLAIALSLIYYQFIEKWNKPYLSTLLLVYWLSCLILGGITLSGLFHQTEIDKFTFRIWLTLLLMMLFLILAVIEVNLIVQEVRLMIRHK